MAGRLCLGFARRLGEPRHSFCWNGGRKVSAWVVFLHVSAPLLECIWPFGWTDFGFVKSLILHFILKVKLFQLFFNDTPLPFRTASNYTHFLGEKGPILIWQLILNVSFLFPGFMASLIMLQRSCLNDEAAGLSCQSCRSAQNVSSGVGVAPRTVPGLSLELSSGSRCEHWDLPPDPACLHRFQS